MHCFCDAKLVHIAKGLHQLTALKRDPGKTTVLRDSTEKKESCKFDSQHKILGLVVIRTKHCITVSNETVVSETHCACNGSSLGLAWLSRLVWAGLEEEGRIIY